MWVQLGTELKEIFLMRGLRLFALAGSFMLMLLLAMIFSYPYTTVAQDEAVGTPPILLSPGVPLDHQFGTPPAPTLAFTECYAAFPLLPNDIIYIEPGVNIRAQANGSSAIVWNTSYNQKDEFGEQLPDAEQFAVESVIVSGPVCSNGYNWWQVRVAGGNDGWVSEGRPTELGGYLLRIPGIDFNTTCTPIFALSVGELATITQNVRVREAPNTDARVKTVAPVGSDVLVLQGPQCDARTGTVWFEVQVVVVDFTYQGWMAQGSGGAVWLIPTDLPSEAAGTLCGSPLGFAVGDLGYVNTLDEMPRYLRQTPGLNGGLLFLLVDGVPFEIIGGPTCVDNINWWQIRVMSTYPASGWISEGSPHAGYWLSPVDPDEFAH
jgi:hypothetical protein